MITDPIADMLTQIRNSLMAKKENVSIPYSKLKHAIAKILVSEGYLKGADKSTDKPSQLAIELVYDEDEKPKITKLKRVSRPSRRIYCSWDKLPWVLNNYGIAIVSTSKGMMTNREARKKKIGGEIICEVY